MWRPGGKNGATPGKAGTRNGWFFSMKPGPKRICQELTDATPAGQRLIAKVPHGHWKTTTFLAGLRTNGWVAPLVIDGALNGALFLNYVRQHLAPALQPGDFLILDNLASHKVRGVREAIEAVGAHVLDLPPYSPDLNPIELAFSKLRRLLRSLATRTIDALWQACGTVLQAFSATEIQNYFRHAGYRYT